MLVCDKAPYSGHFGFRKTIRKTATKSTWRGIQGDAKKYCASCESYQLNKKGQRRRAQLDCDGEVAELFEGTALGIVGSLPRTTEGNRYTVVFVYHFTKPLPDPKTETVAKAFVESLVLRHRFPEQVLTARGTNCVYNLMNETWRLLGIYKVVTTAYCLELNGVVEVLNETIK